MIELTVELPGIHDGYTTIDASDAGVIVDGTCLDGTDAHGFFIQSSGNTLKAIQLQRIPGVGVLPCFCAKAPGFYSITQTQVISNRQLGLV